ncbi:MAG: hypothetical protein L0Z73_17245 [Gammaproteobacteria bacterium]|nr:hypothetical protein [Gammaproteobacteria bacterium]
MLRGISQGLAFGWICCAALLASVAVASEDQAKIDYILKMETPPLGVVFEIIEGSPNDLDWAVPRVVKFSRQLRDRFPNLAIAVVSHGKEQFGLMTSEAKAKSEVHKSVKSLTQEQDIPVHVCGTHASWYGKGEKDFPDYVDVTPAGPTQIANYEDMGYEKIILQEPKD